MTRQYDAAISIHMIEVVPIMMCPDEVQLRWPTAHQITITSILCTYDSTNDVHGPLWSTMYNIFSAIAVELLIILYIKDVYHGHYVSR